MANSMHTCPPAALGTALASDCGGSSCGVLGEVLSASDGMLGNAMVCMQGVS
jgi:hypothetical protein